MPNWVKNIITAKAETINKIKEKYFEDDMLSFEKVIPMPKSLGLVSGTITNHSIYYAYSKKDEKEQKEILKILIHHSDRDYIKMIAEIKEDIIKRIENYALEYIPSEQEKDLGIETFEQLGDTYISNIKEYGHATWYEWCIENWGTKWDACRVCYDETRIVFETAWSSPASILVEISKGLKNDEFELQFADEDFGSDNNGVVCFRNGKVIEQDLDKGEDFVTDVWFNNLIYKEKIPDIVDDMFE